MNHHKLSNADTPPDLTALRAELASLEEEHRDYDVAANALFHTPQFDYFGSRNRFQKKKLILKEKIDALKAKIDGLQPHVVETPPATTRRTPSRHRHSNGNISLAVVGA